MTNLITIHPQNPQARLLDQAVKVLQAEGVVAYPTDSGYALGCIIGKKAPLERIRRIRKLEKNHLFTLMCRDLSDIATFARVDNPTYRLLRKNTPGSYTFVLEASKQVPKLLKHAKRKTIGLRIPDNAITLALLAALESPMLSVSLVMTDDKLPPVDIDEVEQVLKDRVDMIIDGGPCCNESTSIIDMTGAMPDVLRIGSGDVAPFIW